MDDVDCRFPSTECKGCAGYDFCLTQFEVFGDEADWDAMSKSLTRSARETYKAVGKERADKILNDVYGGQ